MVLYDYIDRVISNSKLNWNELENLSEADLNRLAYGLSFFTHTDDQAHVYDKESNKIDTFIE